jgi:hypothetical protein
MRKQQIENAAFEVATQIRTVEDSIDTTLSEIAELQCRMLSANAIAHVGPAPIHSALEELSAALSSLIAARGAIVGCHTQLAEAKGKVPGLRTTSFGEGDQCPPSTGTLHPLRVVA